ncbi:hypothetical protein VP01_2655g2 [Puccinia sorghi]|uniref:Uncharacterized protein n=1 Tax=Puccinia sorghi TaxID=27349 RepID=A0A0L6V5X7_9BASI|nr:hypothetical protein VP01_2655g2 [Puccinia sorghi]
MNMKQKSLVPAPSNPADLPSKLSLMLNYAIHILYSILTQFIVKSKLSQNLTHIRLVISFSHELDKNQPINTETIVPYPFSINSAQTVSKPHRILHPILNSTLKLHSQRYETLIPYFILFRYLLLSISSLHEFHSDQVGYKRLTVSKTQCVLHPIQKSNLKLHCRRSQLSSNSQWRPTNYENSFLNNGLVSNFFLHCFQILGLNVVAGINSNLNLLHSFNKHSLSPLFAMYKKFLRSPPNSHTLAPPQYLHSLALPHPTVIDFYSLQHRPDLFSPVPQKPPDDRLPDITNLPVLSLPLKKEKSIRCGVPFTLQLQKHIAEVSQMDSCMYSTFFIRGGFIEYLVFIENFGGIERKTKHVRKNYKGKYFCKGCWTSVFRKVVEGNNYVRGKKVRGRKMAREAETPKVMIMGGLVILEVANCNFCTGQSEYSIHCKKKKCSSACSNHVHFEWKLGWSMLHVNCMQLIKFFCSDWRSKTDQPHDIIQKAGFRPIRTQDSDGILVPLQQ